MPVIIFGTSENSRVMFNYLAHDSMLGIEGFTADNTAERPSWIPSHLKVVTFERDSLKELWNSSLLASSFGKAPQIAVPVGYSKMNENREQVFNRIAEYGAVPSSVIHSSAVISMPSIIGEGSWIQENCHIQSGVTLGRGVICWAGFHAGHGSLIEDFVWGTTGSVVCGNCRIGANSFLGANSVIHPGVNVAPRTLIGALAEITRDTEEGDVFLAGRNNKIDKKSWEIDL